MDLREQEVVVVVAARSEIFELFSQSFHSFSIKFPLLSTKHWELFIFGVWSFLELLSSILKGVSFASQGISKTGLI